MAQDSKDEVSIFKTEGIAAVWIFGLEVWIMNAEKSINSSDQIPAEFGAIPDKREGRQYLPPPRIY